MNPAASMKVPIMERVLCEACDHFHSPTKAKRCPCCKADQSNVENGGIPTDV